MNPTKSNIQPPLDNLFEQAANISKAHAYDIVAKQRDEVVEQVKELTAENEKLKKDNESLVNSRKSAMAIAMEFGYKQCEKGENLEAAYINFNKVLNSGE